MRKSINLLLQTATLIFYFGLFTRVFAKNNDKTTKPLLTLPVSIEESDLETTPIIDTMNGDSRALLSMDVFL